MNRLLLRPTRPTSREDFLRLSLMAVLLAACSIGWHVLRPSLITAAARSSVGCSARNPLVAEALESTDRDYFHTAGCGFWSIWGQRARLMVYRHPLGSDSEVTFVDHSLKPIGAIRCSYAFRADDADNDGCIEVIAWSRNPNTAQERAAVIRLGPHVNELLGFLTYTRSTRFGTDVTWQDQEDDGSLELVLMPYPARGAPTPPVVQPVQPAAIFEWTAPGGVLRPRSMPADGSVTFWSPPDGQPVPFPSDESLDSVLDRVVAESGPPSTAPSSSPAP